MTTYQEEEYRGYTIRICYDEDCENPRTWGDGWRTKIVCWHRRHNLGDKHSYSDSEDFLRDLAAHHNNYEIIFNYLTSHKGDAWLEFVKWTPEEIEEYELEKEGRYILHDASGKSYYDCEFDEDADMTEIVDKCWEHISEADCYHLVTMSEELVISPVSIYDHSGVTIYMGGKCDAWDSCCVGYIYQTKAITIKENGANEENWKEVAWKNMEAEMKVYDAWGQGKCFGYQVEDEDGEEIDSCWGYVGDDRISEMIAECKSTIDSQIQKREEIHASRIALITSDFDLMPNEWMYVDYSGAYRIDRNNLFQTKQLSYAKAKDNVILHPFAQFPDISELPEDVLEAMENTIKQLKAA